MATPPAPPDAAAPVALPGASRRAFLQWTGAAAAGAVSGCATKAGPGDDGDSGAAPDSGPLPAAPARPAEPAELWSPGGAEDTSRFPWGVQVGDPDPSGAWLSARSDDDPLTARVAVQDGEGWSEVDPVPLTRAEGARTARARLSGLPPDSAVCVCVEAPDGARSRVVRFRTAPDAAGWRVITFGASSCFGGNEPWPSLLAGAPERLDFFCLLGDTVYADGSRTVADYRLFWDAALRTPGLVEMSGHTGLIVTWDDHEVDNNWSADALADGQLEAGVAAFREALPWAEGGGGPAGLWRRLSWGAALDVFVLDCRGERQGGDYISAEQLAWLKQALLDSPARFKIILNSVPITNLTPIFGQAQRQDRWEGYEAQRTEILTHIRDQGIGGVLWVAGDVHYAQIGAVDDVGGPGEGQWEVFTGPAGSFQNIAADYFVGHPQYLWMSSAWNWCRFTCDPERGTVRVQHIGDDGQALSDHTLELP